MSDEPKTTRPDEPPTFADMSPPGYWSEWLGYLVPVRLVSDKEFWEDNDTLKDCLEVMAEQRKGFGNVRR